MADPAPTGALLRLYLGLTGAAAPFATRHLKKRLLRGKEAPDRWREKLGETALPRPEGPLIWMHAVGLGEVLALRGLIDAMRAVRPDLHFLVTSSARASGNDRTIASPTSFHPGRFPRMGTDLSEATRVRGVRHAEDDAVTHSRTRQERGLDFCW